MPHEFSRYVSVDEEPVVLWSFVWWINHKVQFHLHHSCLLLLSGSDFILRCDLQSPQKCLQISSLVYASSFHWQTPTCTGITTQSMNSSWDNASRRLLSSDATTMWPLCMVMQTKSDISQVRSWFVSHIAEVSNLSLPWNCLLQILQSIYRFKECRTQLGCAFENTGNHLIISAWNHCLHQMLCEDYVCIPEDSGECHGFLLSCRYTYHVWPINPSLCKLTSLLIVSPAWTTQMDPLFEKLKLQDNTSIIPSVSSGTPWWISYKKVANYWGWRETPALSTARFRDAFLSAGRTFGALLKGQSTLY